VSEGKILRVRLHLGDLKAANCENLPIGKTGDYELRRRLRRR
jgi:hypothetical protein